MTPPFELYIATRYLLARRRQAFISLISAVSTAGVAVGVMALVVAMALLTGMQQELRDRIIGASAHVYVWKITGGGFGDVSEEAARLMGVPGVVGAAPSITGKAVATTPGGEAFISLKGVDPELEATVTEVGSSVRHGSLQALQDVHDESLFGGVVIGEDLALTLGAFVGDTISVLTPESATLSPVGPMLRPRPAQGGWHLQPRVVRVRQRVRVCHPGRGRSVVQHGPGRDDGAARRWTSTMRPEVAHAVETLAGGYVAQDWAQMNQALFSALRLERLAIAITIGLIMMVAALNIVASLILLVMEKSRDIAILKTMGASSDSIRSIFVMQGGIIGAVGTAIGAVSGVVISYLADRYKLIQVPIDVYDIAWIPFTVEPVHFLPRRRRLAGDLPARHDLSVASGVPSRPGRGAPVSIVPFLDVRALAKSYTVGGRQLVVLRGLDLGVDQDSLSG